MPCTAATDAMTDYFATLKLVTERLDALGTAYMLTGSIAAGYYAQPRMTRDIDLVVELEPADAERIAGVFTRRGVARRCSFAMFASSSRQCPSWISHIRWAASLTVTDLLREVRA